MEGPDDLRYAYVIGCSSLFIAEYLAQIPVQDPRRAQKMRRVAKLKRARLRAAFPDLPESRPELLQVIRENLPSRGVSPATSEQRMAFLIDVAFVCPFSPYDLKYSDKDFRLALETVARQVDLAAEDVKRIFEARDEANRALSKLGSEKILMAAIGGTALAALGGWFAAPLLGAILGTGAGLGGAAAVSYGLALLGGGSLAVGGAGMAGGMWLVTGTFAAAGLAGASSSALCYQLGAAATRMEIIKLQVNFRENILRKQADVAKAQAVIAGLRSRIDEVQCRLNEEHELNESNSQRIRDIKETLTALKKARQWMEHEQQQDSVVA